MTSEQIIRRSDILNTKVITDDNAKQLGLVSQLWVDIDRQEVVALSLRDNLIAFSGVPRYMYLSSIRKIGDVLLVDNEDVIEDIDVEAYSNLINYEVITETGELLGRVRSFVFNPENGRILSLIIASIGIPQIPDQVLSTYELPIDEIISSGANRIIVVEGAEERLNQLTVGLLERLGIGKAPWERDEEEAYYTPTTTKAENQLGTGVPLQAPTTQVRTNRAVVEQAWDEDDYEYELEERQPPPQQQLRQRQYESVQYEDDLEEDNWSEASAPERYEPKKYLDAEISNDSLYDDELEDAWDDEPKPLNIPKKNKDKVPEYEEEEGGY
ncbi:PRC-barrel domain-containing protein [Aliterella atlantica]|uniref:Photosystem reaction center subunit H n=1 Tax=Aliterella atlantica CENA595 TaxID=1618023 RepID=A0A0D8ZKW3_9CYAN|nr:PRC-barrel domain-containing protein [Aliterella atlantica]KJH69478.1 photosystem reaction center subunit H [Aliterella atlantica CENA595]